MRTSRFYSHSRFAAVLPVLAAAWLLTGCTDPAETPYAPAERLTGDWRWVSSTDVQTQQVRTPATEGFDATLELRATAPREGDFLYSRSDSEPLQGMFVIGSEDGPGNDFILIDREIDFLRQAAWLVTGVDSLHLNGVFELGYYSRYVRVD